MSGASSQASSEAGSLLSPFVGPRGEVHVDMAGPAFRLVPSFANLTAVEAVTGFTLIQLARQMHGNEMPLNVMVKIMAMASEPKISEKQLGKLVDQDGFMPVIQSVAAFIASALQAGNITQSGQVDQQQTEKEVSPGKSKAARTNRAKSKKKA